jgi:predicted outer membrane repeat protein/parallel beta-helix repeat protein
VIQNNWVQGNWANYGGGIYSLFGSPAIRNNMIKENAAKSGGAIYCTTTIVPAFPTIEGNIIEGNVAENGGGIYCDDISPSIQSNTIRGNAAQDGAGIHCCRSSSPTVQNNIIEQNTAHYGGAIYCCSCSCPGIHNNTISANKADDGGGIYCSSSSPTITDCIVWSNGEDLSGCSAEYCCIEDPDEGEGNIHEDPMFVPGPFGHYYLDRQSPCIEAGSRSAEDAGLSGMTTQTDGTPDTGRVDMGCHYPIP